MATLVIKDLVLNEELDCNAMTNVRGGMLHLAPRASVLSPPTPVWRGARTPSNWNWTGYSAQVSNLGRI
jgi:hypothetical protein